jgi:hypothetical protein
MKFCRIQHCVIHTIAYLVTIALKKRRSSARRVLVVDLIGEKSGVSSLMEYINAKANGRQTRASARRSIDGVIELICQFANYTDEFVWWPPRGRVLCSSIASGSVVGCLLLFPARVREIAACGARACMRACMRARSRAPTHNRVARCTDSTSSIGAPKRRIVLILRLHGGQRLATRRGLTFVTRDENPVCGAAAFANAQENLAYANPRRGLQLSGTHRGFACIKRKRKRHWILNFPRIYIRRAIMLYLALGIRVPFLSRLESTAR